jgi:filamentous hemagglutinin
LHPAEKTLAQKIAEKAKAQGITNPDGSPIAVDEIENALRAANNSQYGEFVGTGMAEGRGTTRRRRST